MRMQFERSRTGPRAKNSDVTQKKTHQFATRARTINVRNHFQQIVRCVRQLLAFGLEVERHDTCSPSFRWQYAGCRSRASQAACHCRRRSGSARELLRETPNFATTGNRTFIIEIHCVSVVAEAPLLASRPK